MFDFAWSEIALIAAVALIAIGPKDMPVAIRTVAGMVKKARRMAAEFQTHIDEMVREANLDEVKSQFNEIRNFDFKTEVEKAIDPDHTLRDTFADIPLPSEPAPGEHPALAPEAAAPPPEPEAPRAPAFIPPNLIPPPEPLTAAEPEAPAFIPPQFGTRTPAS
jgi:sec-independent protein translocase protein TatB